jgi:hypothetical protein
MNATQRAALRLDIAARILAADIANKGLPRAIGIPDAISLADLMIRSNEEFDGVPSVVGIVPFTVRERILDVAYELHKVGTDFQVPRIIGAFNALRIAAGITDDEIDRHEPF